MPKIANTNARTFVKSRMEFTGSNLYGRWTTSNLYVVYSYGDHFPLWVYDDVIGHWLENTSKYSQTTSIHKTRTNPYAGMPYIALPNDDMKSVILHGSYNYWLAAMAARRLAGGAV